MLLRRTGNCNDKAEHQKHCGVDAVEEDAKDNQPFLVVLHVPEAF